MKLRNCLTIACIGVLAAMTACTTNGKLQQYIENNNIRLAGQEISPGFYCEGMTIDVDTVVVTYNIPGVTATDSELQDWNNVVEQHRALMLGGLAEDKTTDPEGAELITESGVYMKGVFKYANVTVDALLTPAEISQVLR